MTKEEAIYVLSHKLLSMEDGFSWEKTEEAFDMAIAALRAQPAKLGRSRWEGCWWCKDFRTVPLRGFTPYGCMSTTAHFCPNCGKPLTEEAWAEL